MLPIPNTIEEITTDWLSQALRSRNWINTDVVSAVHAPIGDDVGLLSKVVRTELRYANPTGTEPESLVVKIEPAAGPFRESAEKANVFAREIRFYEEIAPQAPVRVPRFYYGDVGEKGGVLILEDLTRLHQHSQVTGLSNVNILAAVKQCGKLHAHFWDKADSPDISWIPRDDGRLYTNVVEQWDHFEEVFGERIGQQGLELGRWVHENMADLQRTMSERTHTVCHADFRADNLLFGEPGSDEEVVVYDWQLATRAMGALDLGRLVGGSELVAERRLHPMEALNHWHDTLLNHGVKDYHHSQALDDFRIASVANLGIPVRLHCLAKDSTERFSQLVDVMAERLFASAIDVEAWKALD